MNTELWQPLEPEMELLTIEDVYVDDTGLIIKVSANSPTKLVFKDFRCYRVGYESDFSDALPATLSSPISVSGDTEWLRSYKHIATEYAHVALVHTIVLDMAFVVEVISQAKPEIEIIKGTGLETVSTGV